MSFESKYNIPKEPVDSLIGTAWMDDTQQDPRIKGTPRINQKGISWTQEQKQGWKSVYSYFV